MGKWRRISYNDKCYCDVAVRADGTIHNPNGYPEEEVRAAVQWADEWEKQRRLNASKKAAETRRRRRDKRIYEVTSRIIAGHVYGPADTCAICRKGLDDPQSVERGIGSDCWQLVMRIIEKRSAAVA